MHCYIFVHLADHRNSLVSKTFLRVVIFFAWHDLFRIFYASHIRSVVFLQAMAVVVAVAVVQCTIHLLIPLTNPLRVEVE